jgi:hypothetical protein
MKTFIQQSEARGSIVGWGNATSRKVAVSNPDEVIGVFNWPNPSSRTGPGVDSVSNRIEYQESSWGKVRPAREADNHTAICEPIV